MFTTCREWHPLCLKLSSTVQYVEASIIYLPGEYCERQPGSTSNLIPRLPPSLSPTRGTLGKKLVPLLVYVSQLPTNHCYIARLGLPESPVVIITGPVYNIKVGSGSAGDGSVPAVPYLPVDVAHVKPLKIQAHLEEVLAHTRRQ